MALAIAAAEARSLRRMPRTWLLAASTFGVGFVSFFIHAMLHLGGSDHSPSASGVAPAFMVSGFGGLALWTALAGSALLAFDARSRDRRVGIAETLDARPVSNLEVLAGRLVAVVLVAWLPLLALAGAVQTAQALGNATLPGFWMFGGGAEPRSLMAFLAVDAPTALILMVAAVAFVGAALDKRLLVATATLAAAGLLFWAGFHTPLYLLPATFGPVAFGSVGSDLLPDFAGGRDVVQRASLLVAAAGLLVAAAACHGRRDAASRMPGLCAGAALVVAGIGGVGALVWLANAQAAERAAWTAVHRELRNAPRADVESISGRVRIEPGALLDLDVVLGLRLPPGVPPGSLTISLNPGLRVEALRAAGDPAAFRHADGLLQVELPGLPARDAPVRLALRAAGVPDARFAYLDSALDATLLTLAESQLHLLGTEAALFEDDYVALMPGARWLPTPGANFASDDPTALRRDFFDVDLQVEVPKGWLAAGPGLREEIGGDGAGARFRFRPAAPVHEVAILAADFVRRATAAHGVELELLMHREHVGNLARLAAAATALASRVDTAFEAFSDGGLAYPFRGLSVVEIPGRLRGYGGGWRMDTVQSLPGMVLLREHGFPTASLQRLPIAAYIRGQALAPYLASYFANDRGGGDPTRGVARNLLAFQTAAHQGADALDSVVSELVQKQAGTWTQSASAAPFSAYAYVGESATTPMPLIHRAAGITYPMRFAPPLASTPAAWERIADGPLAAFAASDHGATRSAASAPEALDAWLLRGAIIADALHDVLGSRSPAVLAELRRRHAGGAFSAADFDAVASDLGMPLQPGIGDWLRETELPGFLVSPLDVMRLADDDQGRPRYQMTLHVRNDQPTSGLVRLQVFPEQPDPLAAPTSEPIRVAGDAAVEIGLVHPSPPEAAMVKTYLSLNRGPVYVAAPRADSTVAHRAAPHAGARSSDWQPRWKDWIVVDDLDAGFRVEEEQPRAGLLRNWSRTDAADVPQDAGLPAYRLNPALPGCWLRETTRWGWGRYRRTIARAFPGDGRNAAVFVADIPRAGRWRLDYHLPAELVPDSYAAARRDNLGRYRMTLVAGGDEQIIDFDADAGVFGWNRLGEFRLDPGEVRLRVGTRTSGELVIADAIRWRPVAAQHADGRREAGSPGK